MLIYPHVYKYLFPLPSTTPQPTWLISKCFHNSVEKMCESHHHYHHFYYYRHLTTILTAISWRVERATELKGLNCSYHHKGEIFSAYKLSATHESLNAPHMVYTVTAAWWWWSWWRANEMMIYSANYSFEFLSATTIVSIIPIQIISPTKLTSILPLKQKAGVNISPLWDYIATWKVSLHTNKLVHMA